MEAWYLTQFAEADQAFEPGDLNLGNLDSGDIRIAVDSFGLNFADVMARKGLYRDCPPLPAILGYEVVGRIKELGSENLPFKVGDRIAAMTRFGAYAREVITPAMGAVKVPNSLSDIQSLALITQYATAYHMGANCVKLRENDSVLIHAAAGGVGTALVQWAKAQKCQIFGTSSPQKHDFLKTLGVDHPIDYRSKDFSEEISQILRDKRLNVIFDPIGGKAFKKGMDLLAPGGSILCFGASSFTQSRNFFSKIKNFIDFGFYHPLKLMGKSQSLIGVNMLRLGDHKPTLLKEILEGVMDQARQGVFRPMGGQSFEASELAEAHAFLESRQSLGKVALRWESEN